jgi:hypothetical protein
MHVKAELNSYEKLPFTITLTAPVEDWRSALKQLEILKNASGYVGYPLSGLSDCVRKMLEDLDKTHADVLIHEPEHAQTEG